MPKTLTKKDYEAVLNYYAVPIKKGERLESIRKKAEDILSNKLCRCIKKVVEKPHTDGEKRAIAICKKGVLHKKGLTDSGFSCKQKRGITLKKKGGKRFYRTRKVNN